MFVFCFSCFGLIDCLVVWVMWLGTWLFIVVVWLFALVAHFGILCCLVVGMSCD